MAERGKENEKRNTRKKLEQKKNIKARRVRVYFSERTLRVTVSLSFSFISLFLGDTCTWQEFKKIYFDRITRPPHIPHRNEMYNLTTADDGT